MRGATLPSVRGAWKAIGVTALGLASILGVLGAVPTRVRGAAPGTTTGTVTTTDLNCDRIRSEEHTSEL